MRLVRCADCGNSPKNRAAEDFAVALMGGDGPGAASWLSEGAMVEVVGGPRLVGAGAILARLQRPEGLEIQVVLSHGRQAAVSGLLTRGREARPFALVLTFASAAAKAVREARLYGAADPALF